MFCFSLVVAAVTAFTPNKLVKLSQLRNSILKSTPVDDKSEKLMFDKESNRFFETDPAILCQEEFCLVDADTGGYILLTQEEKERIFLDSIQSYYATGKNTLPDDQFDRLKDDLAWEGSPLVTFNRNETLFVNAMEAYTKGKPILSDKEWDDLKTALKESGSKVAVTSKPECYVDSGICKITWKPNQIKTNSLYVPATLIATVFYLGIIYEIPFLRALNPLVALALGAVPITTFVKSVTETIFFEDPFVASGPCPNCGVENSVFFGSVLGVQGDTEESGIKCTNCKAGMTVKRRTLRVSTLMSKKGPPAKQAKSEDDE